MEWGVKLLHSLDAHIDLVYGYTLLTGKWKNNDMSFSGINVGLNYEWDPLNAFSYFIESGTHLAFYRTPEELGNIRFDLSAGARGKWNEHWQYKYGVKWTHINDSRYDGYDSIWMIGGAIYLSLFKPKITLSDQRKKVFYDPRLINRKIKTRKSNAK